MKSLFPLALTFVVLGSTAFVHSQTSSSSSGVIEVSTDAASMNSTEQANTTVAAPEFTIPPWSHRWTFPPSHPPMDWSPPVLSTDSGGQNTLSPICSGGAFRYNLSQHHANQTVRLASSTDSTTLVALDCFSFLRVPTPSTAECWNATRRIEILMDVISNSTGDVLFTVPLSNIFGASMSALTWATPEPVMVSYYIRKPDNFTFPQGCDAELQFSMPKLMTLLTTPLVPSPGPRFLHATPFIMEKGEPITFSFAVPNSTLNVTDNKFYVAAVQKGCWAGPSGTLGADATPDVWTVPDALDRWANKTLDTMLRWNTTINNHGHYFLCTVPAGFNATMTPNVKGIEVGYFEVYGGNPAFYTVLGGRTKMFTRTQYTLEFEGTALDLRTGHDRAKIVDATQYLGKPTPSCNDPAGLGSLESMDLGPSQAVGHEVQVAHFNFTMRVGGKFFVCYQRYKSSWIRVYPLIYSAPHSANYLKNMSHLSKWHKDATFAPQAIIYTPTPTKGYRDWDNSLDGYLGTSGSGQGQFTPAPPLTSKWCTSNGMYTYDKDEWPGESVSLHFRNQSYIFSAKFQDTLSNVLCVDISLIYLTLPRYDDETTTWSTDVSLACVNECDVSERLQYLIWLYMGGKTTEAARKLVAVGAIGVGTTNSYDGRVSAEPDNSEGDALVVIVVILIVLIVILVVVAIIIIFVKRNNKPVGAATNRPVGAGGSVGPAGTHRSFQYDTRGQQPGGEFDDVVAGISMDSRPLPPRPGRQADDVDGRNEYELDETDANNEALPAVVIKESAPVPVHPR